MWSSRLFWKLFVSYAVLNLAATVTFVVIVSGWQQDQVVSQIKQRLTNAATIVVSDVSELLADRPTKALQTYAQKRGDEVDVRITLVALDGTVLADSSKGSLTEVEQMENHQHRPELVQAKSQGSGTSQRKSPTVGEQMLYVALRADVRGDSAGLVRTALPMTEVLAQVAAIERVIWLVAILVSVAVVVLTYVVSASVARPVGRLTQAAEAIAAGNYEHRVYIKQQDEVRTLAKSFNRMSDRLEAREAQLRSSRQRLAIVLEGMAEGVIALDERERIVLANAAAGRLLDFVPIEAEGRPLLEVVRNHALHEVVAEANASQGARRAEVELGNVGSRTLSVYATLLAGEPSTRFILVLQDVTELRRLESLRHEFVANVSHELKTPLSAIKAYAETLMAGAIYDEQNNKKFLLSIEEQADRLHELILDMLSLARIESQQQAFDIGPVRLVDVVASCLDEHQAAATARQVELVAGDRMPDVQVQADEEGVRQILDNLIDNALKYTPADGKVTVTLREQEGTVVMEVRDTGIGIPEEQLPRVFERFYRVDKARSRELGGTGLGLSIVKHLTQSFGGSVEVESQLGAGTVFVVKLPRV